MIDQSLLQFFTEFDIKEENRLTWFHARMGSKCSLCNQLIKKDQYQIYNHNKNLFVRFHLGCLKKLKQGELL